MKARRTDEMAALIDDEVLAEFAVIGAPDEIGPKILARYGDIVDRLSIQPEGLSEVALGDLLDDLKAAPQGHSGDL